MIRYKDIIIDRSDMTISHRGVIRQFNGSNGVVPRNHAFELVSYLILSGGASKEMAFWHLYANDPDGGPIDGPHVIHIKLNQIAKRCLEPLGLEIRAWKIAGVSYFEIVPKHELAVPNRFSHINNKKFIKMAGTAINSRARP